MSWRTPFARLLIRRAARRLPLRVVDRPAAGDVGDGETHRVRGSRTTCPPDRPRRADRIRRVVHGRGVGQPRPRGVDGSLRHALRRARPAVDSRWLRRWVLPRIAGRDDNTPSGSRRNIGHHYDLSNRLFELFLDETMTYSSALFEPGEARTATSLAAAQRRKIDRLLDQCQVGRGTRLLEIGTGWGELAIRAGRRGADVLTITLSQRAARPRPIAGRRLPGSPTASTCASTTTARYDGTFDAVVSVEMIEAVGAELLADVLSHDRRRARSRRASGHPGDHQAAPAAARRTHRRTAGSTSTSSPAARSPRSRRSRRCFAPNTALRIVATPGLRPRLRRHAGDLAATVQRRRRRRRCARLRRRVQTDVGLLPRLPARPASVAGRLDVEQLILRRGD